MLVATIRALKYHGGVKKEELDRENIEALKKGLPNLFTHLDNITNVYGLPTVVAINSFSSDTKAEQQLIIEECAKRNIKSIICDGWAKGSKGTTELAKEVLYLVNQNNNFHFLYDLKDSIEDKLNILCQKIYHGDKVIFTDEAKKKLKEIKENGYNDLPICVAKTQYSLSDNPKLLGAPTDFSITVKDLKVSAGAGFIVAYCGDILTMPGLPKVPAAENIDIDENGKIAGLF